MITHRRTFCTPKPDADLCIHMDLPLDKTNCGKSGLDYRASGPPGRQAARPSRAAGPSGRRAAGPWAAGLLLAKPCETTCLYHPKRLNLQVAGPFHLISA